MFHSCIFEASKLRVLVKFAILALSSSFEWPLLVDVRTVEVVQEDLGGAEAPQSRQLVAPVVGLASLGAFIDAVVSLENTKLQIGTIPWLLNDLAKFLL